MNMNVTIPTTWEDVTLEKYINLRPILQTDQTPVERVINILCVLTGEKREQIMNIKLVDYHSILKKMDFLNTELPTTLKGKYFEINNDWYEFKLDAKTLLFGEYIYSMEILQKAADNEEVIFSNLHRLLTTICRPVKKVNNKFKPIEMNGELIRKTSDNFYSHMPITIAYPISVFFCNHLPNLMQDIKTSLMRTAQKEIKEVIADLQKDGVGGL